MLVDAFMLSYKRPENIPHVLRGLRRQSFLRTVYVIHNYPSFMRVQGVINIFCQVNFGCIARHAIALLSDCEYALFVDDDLELLTDLSHRFVRLAGAVPFAVAGLFGRQFNATTPSPTIYKSSTFTDLNPHYVVVDIIAGRVHLCKRLNIHHAFADPVYSQYGHSSDDVLLNMSLQMRTGHPSVAVPARREEIRELSRRFSVSSRRRHFLERSELVNHFIQAGWQSLVREAQWLSAAQSLNEELAVDSGNRRSHPLAGRQD